MKKHSVDVFNNFQFPQNIDLLLFSELYVYHYMDIRTAVVNEIEEGSQIYTESIITNDNGEVVYKKTKNFVTFEMGQWAQWKLVWIRNLFVFLEVPYILCQECFKNNQQSVIYSRASSTPQFTKWLGDE